MYLQDLSKFPLQALRACSGNQVLHRNSCPETYKLRRKRRHLVVQKVIILRDNARNHTAAAVTDLLRRWQWEILENPPYSPDMSPFDYDLFAKVQEHLRGTRYNTRDELIRAIERSIRNINKNGRADGVRGLPKIWQISNCCHNFYPTLAYARD